MDEVAGPQVEGKLRPRDGLIGENHPDCSTVVALGSERGPMQQRGIGGLNGREPERIPGDYYPKKMGNS